MDAILRAEGGDDHDATAAVSAVGQRKGPELPRLQVAVRLRNERIVGHRLAQAVPENGMGGTGECAPERPWHRGARSLAERCARHDSNMRPLPPQGSALSPELRALADRPV